MGGGAVFRYHRDMALFALAFLTIYGGFNGYAWWRLRLADLLPAVLSGRPAACLFVIMTLSPILLMQIAGPLPVPARRLAALFTYLWMAGVFQFFCWSVFTRLLLTLGRALGNPVGPWAAAASTPRALFLLPLAIVAALTLYGFREARQVSIRTLTFPVAGLPPGLARFRIMQVSDLHLGMVEPDHRLQNVARFARETAPDLLVGTGDLFDSFLHEREEVAALWASITPPAGKLAVTGNHEFYAGLGELLPLYAAGGFTLLRGEARQVTPFLGVAGVDDPTAQRLGLPPADEAGLLDTLAATGFRLLLKHQPLIDPAARDQFDLQLSGHTHGGQIFPFAVVPRLTFGFWPGLTPVGRRSRLYLSRGTGTWGPPIRVFAPPEIVIIDLVPPAGPAASSAANPGPEGPATAGGGGTPAGFRSADSSPEGGSGR